MSTSQNKCIECGVVTKGCGVRCYSCAGKHRWADRTYKAKRVAAMGEPEYRGKLSFAQKKRFTDPKERQKTSETTRLAMADPKVRYKCSAAATKRMADPELRQRISDSVIIIWADPAYRTKHSDAVRLAMADPEVKKRHLDGIMSAVADPELRQRRSDTTKALWEDPKYREKQIATRNTPEVKQKASKAMKAAHAGGCFDHCFSSPSKLELSVLKALRDYGFECDDQYRPEGYSCIYDILLVNYQTLIEVDGDYWHNLPGAKERDDEKDTYAEAHGFELIRIPEHVINGEGLDYIVEQIVFILEEMVGGNND